MWCGDIIERKISRRLKLIKRVRECYVRKDIPCGFGCCEDPIIINTDFPIFAILAPEMLLKYKALLKSKFLKGIICKSALDSLQKSDDKKTRKIAKDMGHIIFCDTFHESTSGRGLEGVLEFYQNHIPELNFIILNENNISEYGKYFDEDITEFTEKVEVKNEINYEDYLENLDILESNGTVLKGYLQINSYNCYSGVVLNKDKRINIIGKLNLNRAIHGDEVYVKIIEEKNDDHIFIQGDNLEVDKTEIETSEKNVKCVENKIFGKIVGIYKRKPTRIVGTVCEATVSGTGVQYVLVLPIDRRIPAVRIRTGQVEEMLNKRLCVEIDFWDKDSNYPMGHYYKKLGEMGDKESEIQGILLSHSIDYFDHDWEKILGGNINKEDYNMTNVYNEVENGTRSDFRNLNIMSIDPIGCTDIDDALHCRKLPNGNWEVGVHIADVTFFVKEGSLLDKIAADRATTVYLPDRRIDMIPPFLSAGLCSLLENEDRAAFSVVWEMTPGIEIVKTFFTKSLIRSKKAFSYEEANKILNGSKNNPFFESLTGLNEISKVLRLRRFDNGALDLSSRELVVKDGKFKFKDPVQANFLIEEYMLLANISVAKFTNHHCPDTSLLRKHPFPSTFADDLEIDTTSSKTINESLSKINDEKKAVIKKVITRSMNQAIYIISGKESDFNHYGLACEIYTHFTSPIRRYADVVVHRTLENIITKLNPSTATHIPDFGINTFLSRKEALVQNTSEYDSFVTPALCNDINKRHRSAQRASWDVTKLFSYYILRDIEPVSEAFVMKSVSNGVVVYIPEFNIEEIVYTNNNNEYNVFEVIKVKIIRDDEKFFLRRAFNIIIVE